MPSLTTDSGAAWVPNCHFPSEITIVEWNMRNQVTLDRAGRVVLPKALRDELHLFPGDTLDVTIQDDAVTLHPRRSATPLQKERGVWVLRTGEPLSARETNEMLGNIRAQRGYRHAGDGE